MKGKAADLNLAAGQFLQAERSTWGISLAMKETLVRLLSVGAGLWLLALTIHFHQDFFGNWTGVAWGGWALGVGVTAGQLAWWHGGYKDPVLMALGILCYLYDIIACSVGIYLAVGSDALFAAGPARWVISAIAGSVVSVLAERLVDYGLVAKAAYKEG